jgi:hypothetical protein
MTPANGIHPWAIEDPDAAPALAPDCRWWSSGPARSGWPPLPTCSTAAWSPSSSRPAPSRGQHRPVAARAAVLPLVAGPGPRQRAPARAGRLDRSRPRYPAHRRRPAPALPGAPGHRACSGQPHPAAHRGGRGRPPGPGQGPQRYAGCRTVVVEAGRIELISGFRINTVEPAGDRVRLTGDQMLVDDVLQAQDLVVEADAVIAATGFRPDHSIAAELRLALEPALESATAALGPLIDPNVHTCGTVPARGMAELAHPEPGYVVVGDEELRPRPNLPAGHRLPAGPLGRGRPGRRPRRRPPSWPGATGRGPVRHQPRPAGQRPTPPPTRPVRPHSVQRDDGSAWRDGGGLECRQLLSLARPG